MRMPKYLSPTSLKTFETDRVEFYLRYLADNRPPRIPQNHAMAIGSAFDAFVKNYLVGNLRGECDAQFEIEAIFEAQVEPQNRDWAFSHGEALFNQYRESGALANLMLELSHAISEPRFEFEIENRVSHTRHVDGIPLLGKPDCHCVLADGKTLTIDWKVNGYCSKTPTSPKKGYVRLWPGGQSHKSCQPMTLGGITVNLSEYLDSVETDWATQVCVYMWLLGEPIPTKGLVGIEQLACCGLENPVGMRVASHRLRISDTFQLSLLDRLATCWSIVQSGHIFDKLTRVESDARCLMLDQQYLAFNNPDPTVASVHDSWFNSITRGQ